MRNIKFRVWDKKKNDWFDEDDRDLYIELNGNINFGWNGEIMDDYTDRIILMQYTGLFDANLKEIYEGDIVATKRAGLIGTHLYITEARGEVMFGDCNFYIKQTDGIDPLENYSVGFENVVTEIEIIGNIYENPDLLED